jgi:hypothetical protein
MITQDEFEQRYQDYIARRYPDGIPTSAGHEAEAELYGCPVLSAKDDLAISGAVYRELLSERARWCVLVKVPDAGAAADAKEFFSLCGYDSQVCADIDGKIIPL